MALLTSEIARIKAELGFNLLSNSAAPYVDVVAIFENVIQENLSGGAATTSSTTVAAAGAPTPVTLALASAAGVTSGDRLVVDVDSRQEIATIQHLSGTSVTLMLSLAHTGTYPVTVEGPETIVREILGEIRTTRAELKEEFGNGALRKVDEIEWYQAGNKTAFGIIGENLAYYREQLAAALGIPSMWESKRAGAAVLSVY